MIGKPAAAIFRSACRALGLPPAACVMVGDDLRYDVLAAQRAGMRGVFVRTGKGATFADDPRIAQSAERSSTASPTLPPAEALSASGGNGA